MAFWDTVEESDPLTDLLNKPNVQVKEVLFEQSMLQELRTGNKTLLDYLTKESVVTELCQWSMSLQNNKDPEYFKVSSFATNSLILIKALINSTALKTFLEQFLAKPGEWDSICTAHFQKILVELLRNTKGEYLTKLPTLMDSLLAHIDNLAVIELLIILATEFGGLIQISIITELGKFAASGVPETYTLAYALEQIMVQWDKPNVSQSFTNKEFLDNIIKAANTTTDKLGSIELNRLLSRLKTKSAEIVRLLSGKTTDLSKVDTVKSAKEAFNVDYSIADMNKVVNLLCTDCHWAVANQLLDRFKKLTSEQQVELVNTNKVISKLAANALTGFTQQQYALISVLDNVLSNNAEWKSAIPQEAIEKAKLLNISYGGEIPAGFNVEHKINAE